MTRGNEESVKDMEDKMINKDWYNIISNPDGTSKIELTDEQALRFLHKEMKDPSPTFQQEIGCPPTNKSPALNLIKNTMDLFHYARDLARNTDMTIKRLSFEASSGMVLIEFNEAGR